MSYWINYRQFRALPKTQTQLQNEPDAFFIVKRNGVPLTFFLEIDRGTETLVSEKGRTTDMFTKYSRYGSFLKERYADAPFFANQPPPVVLTVTHGGKVRKKGLIETAAKAGCQTAYWFTTADELYASKEPNALFDEVWQVPGEVSCWTILNRR
jgi:hypothetical protein